MPLATSCNRGHCPSVVLYLSTASQRSHFTESWQSLFKVVTLSCTFLSFPKHYFLVYLWSPIPSLQTLWKYFFHSVGQAKLGNFLLLGSMRLSGSNIVEATVGSHWIRLEGLRLMEENSDPPQPHSQVAFCLTIWNFYLLMKWS